MTWPDLYLLCFAVGTIWAFVSLLLGGLHFGHLGSGHSGHGHLGHTVIGHAQGSHAQVAHGHGAGAAKGATQQSAPGWIGFMVNPSCIAVYLAWFGGVGYLLTRHSGLTYWLNLVIATSVGLTGAWILASFLRFLQAREKPLDPSDYEMVGVLGRVSSVLRPGRVGEVIYLRDGARCPICARTEDGKEIARGEEVIVTRYEKGIAYVRTWESMTQSGPAFDPESSVKEKYVE